MSSVFTLSCMNETKQIKLPFERTQLYSAHINVKVNLLNKLLSVMVRLWWQDDARPHPMVAHVDWMILFILNNVNIIISLIFIFQLLSIVSNGTARLNEISLLRSPFY